MMWVFDGRTRLNWPLALLAVAALASIKMSGAWGQAANANAAAAAAAFTLQPGDEIEVSVYGEMELQRKMLIRPDGKFSFPLAGEVVAISRSVADVQMELTSKIRPLIPEAVVTVSVTGLEGHKAYVIGQVIKPGAIPLNPRINVLQALSVAGGTTAFAALNDIIILRGTGREQRVLRFAYDDIKRGRNLEQNIQLENGDVVLVP
jgi:polysaccharide export outer membrane protein